MEMRVLPLLLGIYISAWKYALADTTTGSIDITTAKTSPTPPSGVNIRLVNGVGAHEGRVELQSTSGGPWGTMCDDLYWGNNAATVICRHLGYMWGEGFRLARFGAGNAEAPIYLDDVRCTGLEDSILDCKHDEWSKSDCSHSEDAGARCHNSSVRLQSEIPGSSYGAVQIRYKNRWADVCDESWNNHAAKLVCQELGFVDGSAQCCSTLAVTEFSNVAHSFTYNCNDNDTVLANCSSYMTFDKCDFSKRASVICHNVTLDSVNDTYALRLSSGDTNWGFVEVRHAGIWGRVCNKGWGDSEANVTCRELNQGFIGGVFLGPPAEKNPDAPYWITKLTCPNGTETSLQKCNVSQWGTPRPYNCRPAQVLCYNESGVSIKLKAGASPFSGLLEISYDGSRGLICKNGLQDMTASVVCRGLGYAAGNTADVVSETGPYFINSFRCKGQESSLFSCPNSGWKNNTQSCKETSQIVCYKRVRLSRGTISAGMVMVFEDDDWLRLCNVGFTQDHALLVCKEMGFTNGSLLPIAAYGKIYNSDKLIRPNLNCSNASSIIDCTFDKAVPCSDTGYSYVSVSCFNGPVSSETEFNIQGATPESSYGHLMVRKYGVWGQICEAGWGDTEANLVCTSEGFLGGISMVYRATPGTPTLVSSIVCKGSEKSLSDCAVRSDFVCYGDERAGVLCYRESAPTFHLVGGGDNYGIVEVDIDGTRGTICDTSLTDADAKVICQSLGRNFTSGEAYSGFEPPTVDTVLSGLDCTGLESSPLTCNHNGWKSVYGKHCLDHKSDVGVYCYGKVRVVGGKRTVKYVSGRVEVLSVTGGTDWISICGDGFDQTDAGVVCKELGFNKALILAPGSFGLRSKWKYYTNMTCDQGGNSVHGNCTFDTGACRQTSHSYASVMCMEDGLNPDTKVFIENEYAGLVVIQQYGINGTICADGWDDNDASVVCRHKGFKGGVVLGVSEIYSRTTPIWFTNYGCVGNETDFDTCSRSRKVPMLCSMSLKSVGVLCYRSSGVEVRLNSPDRDRTSGRVEISVDGVWGTICNYDWSTYDARVICRHLGFRGGIPGTEVSSSARATGPVYLSGLTCDNTETSILACPNLGWNRTQSSCADHFLDATVSCQSNVRTSVAKNFGPVEVFNTGIYGLVCSDGFDVADAKSVCYTMGYATGTPVCCSAFGNSGTTDVISFSNPQCDEDQAQDFLLCPKDNGLNCSSGLYASVVCAKSVPPIGFGVDIWDISKTRGIGPVKIDYFMQKGYICSDNFTDNDADVICKQLEYAGGLAYIAKSPSLLFGRTRDIHWLRSPGCTGQERSLVDCPLSGLGNLTGGCSVFSHAGVICHSTPAGSGFNLRLVNSPHPGEGYVQVKINGTWGSMCALRKPITDTEAMVICRQLNYQSGIAFQLTAFPHLKGPVWLNGVTCNGTEDSILSCQIQEMANVPSHCLRHNFDVAVKCSANVRVSASSSPRYGMVQMLNKTTTKWVSVCDTDFDDVDASVLCRDMGYKGGKAQCCSSLGDNLERYNPIQVSHVNCTGSENKFAECQMSTGANLSCPSGHYASALCVDNDPPVEGLKVNLTEAVYYGHLEVQRYGLWGSVCDLGWDDKDAAVVCRSLGFATGFATNGTYTAEQPMLVSVVHCNGTENSLSECSIPPFNEGHACVDRPTRAAVVCSTQNEPIKYRVADGSRGAGRAEIYINGQWGTICASFWNDVDAAMFCRKAGYMSGYTRNRHLSGPLDRPIWMTEVDCTGNETDFFQCRASWNVKSSPFCNHFNNAGVQCLQSVRLRRGDRRTTGIIEIAGQTGRFFSWKTVCADSFTDTEAKVACNILGHEHGMSLCCSPYGYSSSEVAEFTPKCNGTEIQIGQCQKVTNVPQCGRQSYASVACYNGTRPRDNYRVSLQGSVKYTGEVEVTYMNVVGRICWDGWDDRDARVVCRELGYSNGSAYYHYKSSFIYLDYNGPYWTSQVNCTGDERRLGDCPHAGFGNVTTCSGRGHYAGVVCFDESGLSYRIGGGDDRYGRVEFSYHDQWYTICSSSWDIREAHVMCRQLGYRTGDIYTGGYLTQPTGSAWSIEFRCSGEEASLSECAHEGLHEAQYCEAHKDDDGVFCYTSVKLSGKEGTSSDNGTVLYYHDNQWKRICDDGFDDVTARRVCQELGYADGRAICCSAYGTVYEELLSNYTLHCNGDETSIEDCLKPKECNSSHYASAICFKPNATINEDAYTITLKEADKGQVKVTHFGVEGRICSRSWDDNEAEVVCRQNGYIKGLAYQHSESNVLQEVRGPYWLAGFNCSGTEDNLLDCPHSDRLDLGNCTDKHIASVLCYNETGIEYRMMDGGAHYGRIEVAIGGEWGTVCDQYWDNREARVFCRQMNFTDGEAMRAAHFGEGSGPIWMSHLECKGTENMLHQCPHRGFSNDFSFGWWFPLPCETHADDAGVFCYRSVRLNHGPNTDSGGVEIYHEGNWYGICDNGFDNNAAMVACRAIKDNYVDARPIQGSVYGNLSGEIMFSSIRCNGSEKDLLSCDYTFNKTCPSKTYVSVYCSNTTINSTGFDLRLARDTLSSGEHGILEARVNDVWGRVCLHNFDDVDAGVACKQLGYDGGVAYLHIMKNDRPILMWDVQCTGNETSIEDCIRADQKPDLDHCHYGANDAGVICYETTDGVGFEYRLAGGENESYGRVEIGYSGTWGIVCAWSWQSADARVLCKSMGYTDGMVRYQTSPTQKKSWVSGFFCQGHETSPMTCLNTGFNATFLSDLCTYNRREGESGAYTECFHADVVPTQIRLVNGPNEFSGRVEVYVSGPNKWGTICDDYWEEAEAEVVCRQLGFYGGTPLRRAAFGEGRGPIWFDNMACKANETSLFDCGHRGIGTHNCGHGEDVGVICVSPNDTTSARTTTALTTQLTTLLPTKIKTSISTTALSTTTTTTKSSTIQITSSTTTETTSISTTTSTTASTTSTTASTTSTTSTQRATRTTTTTTTTITPYTTAESGTIPTTQKVKTTSKLTTVPTTEGTTQNFNATGSRSGEQSEPAKAAIITVPIVLVLLIVIFVVVIVFIYKHRRTKKPGFSHERFDEGIITQEQDGSVSAENQLYAINNMQPSRRSNGAPADDKITFGNNGNAFYMQNFPNGNGQDTSAFTNPLYEANSDLTGQATEEVDDSVTTLPVVSQTGLPLDTIDDPTSTA